MRRIFTIVLIVSAILMFSSCAQKPDGKVNDLFDRTVSANEAPETALFDSYEYYVLTDDEDVTWDEIMKGLYSSDSHTPRYRHLTVCENFEGWKGN